MKNVKFYAAVSILICIIAFFARGTMVSRAQTRNALEAGTYHEMERQYIKEMKEFLKEAGYENSGVNLTKVTDIDGSRSYQIKIHHPRIDKLKDTEREGLLEELNRMQFVEEASVEHEFF